MQTLSLTTVDTSRTLAARARACAGSAAAELHARRSSNQRPARREWSKFGDCIS